MTFTRQADATTTFKYEREDEKTLLYVCVQTPQYLSLMLEMK